MKVHIARDGQVLGEWTQTELYPLLRSSQIFPSDYYWHEGMTGWRRLAELPSGESVLATPAQRQILTNHALPWDEFTTKYQASKLMASRPCTDKQQSFMDDLGIAHFDTMTMKEASDLIDAELARETPDGPATAAQLAIIKRLATEHGVRLTISSPVSRREVADEIHTLRSVPAIPK
jgi:hypothetical protein